MSAPAPSASPTVLALCSGWPVQQLAAGATLLRQGTRSDRLFVLRTGAVDVLRDGVRVVRIAEAGAFLGEMAVVLGSAATADVVVAQDCEVHVLDAAAGTATRDPALMLAIAQLLARRLQAVTTYLADIKRQYADTDTHLAVMDQVLARLMELQPAAVAPGSERHDTPDY